jgi:ABC-2 type transport system permease protein/oleandomycin transport system permease protein
MRHLRVLRENPGRLIYPLVQPLVLLVLFVSVFGNLALSRNGGGGLTYREFLIPGIIIQNAALTAPTTGLALLRDADSGLADRFRALPISRAAVLTGRLLSDAVVFAAQAVLLMLCAGFSLGFRVRSGLAGMVVIVVVAVAFGLAVAVTSAWLAELIGDAETAERVLFFPAIALAFLSSAFAPVALLAGWIQPIARVSPVTAAAGLIRSLASGGPAALPSVWLGCWVAALVLLPGTLAVRRWSSPT